MGKIEWTDRSDWNPIRGCTRVSPGCGGPGKEGGCYAEKIAARFSDPGQPFHGFAERRNGEARWTGRVELIEDRLTEPLRWRKPARIFACSMSDPFHEKLPDEAIDKLFAVMALCHQHTFQVLTKRPERMRDYCHALYSKKRKLIHHSYETLTAATGRIVTDDLIAALSAGPLPNVWLGTSCERQEEADERIPHLLATPAAVRFISAEPLLGPVDLSAWIGVHHHPDNDQRNPAVQALVRTARKVLGPTLDWVIVGGESGPGARPMHPDWARSLRDQCQAASVPFFFKQWGEWVTEDQSPEDIVLPGTSRLPWSTYDSDTCEYRGDQTAVYKVGKKVAGRLLDGREWSEFPR